MSPQGSSSSGTGRGDGETTLVTAMLAVAAIFVVAGTIILSIPLSQWYGQFFWNVN